MIMNVIQCGVYLRTAIKRGAASIGAHVVNIYVYGFIVSIATQFNAPNDTYSIYTPC